MRTRNDIAEIGITQTYRNGLLYISYKNILCFYLVG